MADSMYRSEHLMCPRCLENLYAVEEEHQAPAPVWVTPGMGLKQAPPVRIVVVRCPDPRCEWTTTHPWPGAAAHLSLAQVDAIHTLLERGEARMEAGR